MSTESLTSLRLKAMAELELRRRKQATAVSVDYSQDFKRWVDERAKGFVWSKQIEIANSVRDNRYTGVPSCHAAGKSQLASYIAAWWIDSHPPGEAFVVSTAPTERQVKNILWRYIGRVYRRAGLPGRVTQKEWYLTEDKASYNVSKTGEELVGFGAKPSDHDPGAFQGIHARYVLVIVDESGAVASRELWDAIDSLVTNEDCRVLAIGNPDNANSHFAEICKPGSGYNVIRISAYDTPNFTGEEIPDWLKPLLVMPVWVEERKERWGEDSGVFQAKVLGRFPEDASDGVIPYSWLLAAMVEQEWSERELNPVRLGIDVGASDNGDQTVVREKRGAKLGRVWRFRERDHTKLAPLLLNLIQLTGATEVSIDSTGVGHGIANMLTDYGRKKKHRATVNEVNFGSAAHENQRFVNKRAELHWMARELIQTQAVDFSVLIEEEDGDDVVAELTAPSWSEDASGRVKVETKENVRARLGRSPDDSDAILLACYSPPADGKVWTDIEVEEW